MAAVSSVDRQSLGFSAIEPTAQLRLEWRPTARYDAMLHVEGKTSRTIAFRLSADAFEWIGEQEIFEGPAEYDHADGRSHETITLTFEKVPVSGAPLDEVYVSYWGEDPRLSSSLDRLSLEEMARAAASLFRALPAPVKGRVLRSGSPFRRSEAA